MRHLCRVLADTGAADYAYRLLLNESYPSWGFSIAQGATTIWERWDGWTPERGFQSANMNSFNHYAYGSVGEWLYARMAGIDWDAQAPGFGRVRLRPLFDAQIGHVAARYDAPTGRIESAWQMTGDTVTWQVTLPPNVTGTADLAYAPWAVTADRATAEAHGPGSRLSLGPGRHSITVTFGRRDNEGRRQQDAAPAAYDRQCAS